MNLQTVFASFLILFFGTISNAPAAQTGPTTRPIGADLVTNGSFEQGDAYWPFAPNGAQSSGEVISTDAHSGKHCYKLSNKSSFAPNVYA